MNAISVGRATYLFSMVVESVSISEYIYCSPKAKPETIYESVCIRSTYIAELYTIPFSIQRSSYAAKLYLQMQTRLNWRK